MKRFALALAITTIALPTLAENNLSGELLLGIADQETGISGFSAVSGDDASIGIRGAHQFVKNVAIEFSYQNYGEVDETYIDGFGDTINDKFKTTSINIGVKGILPLENGFSLNGRLGLAMWDYKLKETDSAFPGQMFKVDDDGTDPYYGIGMQYNFNKNLFISAEYTILDLDLSLFGVVAADHEVKNVSLSIGSKF